jgi:hypothetical protein
MSNHHVTLLAKKGKQPLLKVTLVLMIGVPKTAYICKTLFEKVMALCLFNLVMKRFIVNGHAAKKLIMTVDVRQVSFRLAA